MFDNSTQIAFLNYLEVRKYGTANKLNNPLISNTYSSNIVNTNLLTETINNIDHIDNLNISNPNQDIAVDSNKIKKSYANITNNTLLNSFDAFQVVDNKSLILKNQLLTLENTFINGNSNFNNFYNNYGYEKYNSINCIRFDPLEKRVIYATSNGTISIYNPSNDSITKVGSHQTAIKAITFSSLNLSSSVEYNSGNTKNATNPSAIGINNKENNISSIMLSGDNNGSVIVWNNNISEYSYKNKIHLHNQGITDLSFSINGSIFASSSEDKSVKLYDLEHNKELICYSDHNSDVKTCDWAKPRSLLVSSGKDKKIRFFDPRYKESIAVMSGVHFDIINKVRFNSNGNWFITASKEHNLKLVDFRMMKVLQKFDCHTLGVNSVAWNPYCNEAFCSVGEDKKVIYWTVGSEESYCIDNAHDKEVFDVCYNKFGNIAASGSKDSCIKFWN